MHTVPARSSVQGSAENFTGQVWIDQIYRGEAPSRARVNAVHFTPSARTHWHVHTIGQTLHVTEGVGLVVSRDGTAIAARSGDTVTTPPGEWHWHGATSDRFMTHLAISDGTGDPDVEETSWGEPVGDDEYARAQRRN